jgi:putative spermidine/putrescine transport system ATP-binding protein
MTTTLPEPTTTASTPQGPTGVHVQLNDVTMVYGTNAPAVDAVQLDIRPGQFVTLLGASGSGKTTLLRIIAGFQNATSGQIVFDNRTVDRVPVYKRRIGMVFQNYALFPHMTVEKNVAFPLAMAKVRRSDRPALVREALAQVHLEQFGHRMPSELSGGQQQRVALARAIVAKPRLLLMDEPLGALDRRLRENLQVEIKRLSMELGLTVINVTHDQEEALTMSDRIALLIGGRLAQYGSPEDLYNHPANEEVAEFLGESDIFRGTVVEGPGGRSLDMRESRIILGPTPAGTLPEAGTTASVVVRPRHVRTVLAGESPETHCSVPATVITTMFAGDSRKVVAEGPDGQELSARLTPDQAHITEGTRVHLSWNPTDAVTLVHS